jgi:hypothetical protein
MSEVYADPWNEDKKKITILESQLILAREGLEKIALKEPTKECPCDCAACYEIAQQTIAALDGKEKTSSSLH